MTTQSLRKRRKDCSLAYLLLFILGYLSVIALPGFLYLYFWKNEGWLLSALLGLLVGELVLMAAELLVTSIGAIRRFVRPNTGKNEPATKPQPGAVE